MFVSPLCVTPLGIGKEGRIIWEQRHNPLIWDDEQYRIEISAGFQSDFASVPRLPFVYAKWGDRAHHEAALHDYTYRDDCEIYVKAEKKWIIGMPRPDGDALFRKAILVRNYGKDIAYPMWLAVRAAGWPHYGKLSVNHVFELKVVFPEAFA